MAVTDLRHDRDAKSIEMMAEPSAIRCAVHESACLVIDLQNYFLHPALRDFPPGIAAHDVLVETLLPALRKANMRIIYVNWGLTETTARTVPLRLIRDHPHAMDVGTDMGLLDDGTVAGRKLFIGSWNAALYGGLQADFERHQTDTMWFNKERISALAPCSLTSIAPSDAPALFERYLREQGITTLFFAGCKTDVCVLGTLIDAYNKGYNCVLVSDACATTDVANSEFAVKAVTRTYGYVTTSSAIIEGVQNA